MSAITKCFVWDPVDRLQKQDCVRSLSMHTLALVGTPHTREWHNTEFHAGSSKKDTHTVSGDLVHAHKPAADLPMLHQRGGLHVC